MSAFRAAQERTDLREAIAREREAFRHELQRERQQVWREFVLERALGGDEVAISALRGLRYRERWRERALDEGIGFRIHGVGDECDEPRVLRDLRDLEAGVERTADAAKPSAITARRQLSAGCG